jgi:hypothetical protein
LSLFGSSSLSVTLLKTVFYKRSQVSDMKIVHFLYRLLRTDTKNQFLKIKKILNPDPCPPGLDLGIEKGGCHRPRREGGGVVSRRCRSRSLHRGLLSAQIRVCRCLIQIGASPRWGWGCLPSSLKARAAPCLSAAAVPWRSVDEEPWRRASLTRSHGGVREEGVACR